MSKFDKIAISIVSTLVVFVISIFINTYYVHKDKIDIIVDNVRHNCKYVGKGKRISYMIIQDTNYNEVTEQIFNCDGTFYVINKDYEHLK